MKIRLLWMAALAVVCLLVPGKSIHAQSTETSNAKLTGCGDGSERGGCKRRDDPRDSFRRRRDCLLQAVRTGGSSLR